MRKIFLFVTTFLLIFQSSGYVLAAESVFEHLKGEQKTQISPGVQHIKQSYQSNGTVEAVNILDINMNDPFTQIELAFPNTPQTVKRTSQLAKENNREGHHVVGAVNASFFNVSQKTSVNLIAVDNQLHHPGAYSESLTNPLNRQVAFGVDKNGKAVINDFALKAVFTIDGEVFEFPMINQERKSEDAVVFMNPRTSTKTNEWGTEIVIQPVNNEPTVLGKTVKGQISKITRIGTGGNAAVPKNGYVISAHGYNWANKLESVKEGAEVDIKIAISQVWQDAEFLVGSGPLLVRDGKVSISMDENDAFAKYRNPRSAIGVNKAGDKVFMVTIDGRQSGYSNGVSLRELANFMIKLGADYALNLDGGGSTTMAIRQLGGTEPTVINRPSDGSERSVLTSLLAISSAPTSEVNSMKFSLTKGKIIEGASVTLDLQYALDQYYNRVAINPNDIQFSVSNSLGTFEGNKLKTQKAGSGTITASYNGVNTQIPITVVDTFDQLKTVPESIVLGGNESIKLTAKPLDKNGEALLYDPASVKWSVEGDLGTVTADGTFTAKAEKASGFVVATLGKVQTKIPVQITDKPVMVDSFDTASKWRVEQARSEAVIKASSGNGPVRQGKASLELGYDFTVGDEGTKAAYAVAASPITLPGKPLEIGAWVYGDGKNHWLRGVVLDGKGNKHTINFTKEGGLNWTGWNYVQAEIPDGLPQPLKFERMYIAEANPAKQNKGTIYLDQLQAVYVNDYTEPAFTDINESFWAYPSIMFLKENQVINGFNDGSFQPNQTITRAQAALMIVRQLNLSSTTEQTIAFTDVKNSHFAYQAIATISQKGIMNGTSETTFAPNAPLTRAQMAAILQRAYALEAGEAKSFKDVSESHWAEPAIQSLVANGLTEGYEDGTYRPEKATTRAEFSTFIARTVKE